MSHGGLKLWCYSEMRTHAEVLLEAGAVSEAEDRALMDDIVGEAEHMGRLIAE